MQSRFLAHDKGEKFPENNTTWLEDEGMVHTKICCPAACV